MKTALKKLLFAIIAFIALIVCITLWNWREKANAVKNFTAVEAAVTSARSTKSSRVTKKTTLQLEYTYNGQKVETTVVGSTLGNLGDGVYQKGDSVLIYINPKDENDIVVGKIVKRGELNVYQKPKKYEKPDAKQVMAISLNEALVRYGETTESYMGVRDDEFVFRGGEPEFRIELGNFYKPEQYENQIIIIKEVTWQINHHKKITVWYEKQNDTLYIPRHYCIYSDDMEF
ncbi:hypothetical protein AGMMS49574_27520 [Bacteroidia bacterium]|nr:hypothetical protein AGMMS49574_27520 [Bacteroidia bacterium]